MTVHQIENVNKKRQVIKKKTDGNSGVENYKNWNEKSIRERETQQKIWDGRRKKPLYGTITCVNRQGSPRRREEERMKKYLKK